MIPARATALNEKALAIAKTYLNAEAALIPVLQEFDRTRDYLHFGATSLIGYVIEILKLSEGAAANLVTVARKAVEVPALKDAVASGEVTLNKARRLASVITKENQNQWLALAKASSSRVLEKEIAKFNPQFAIPERLKYKTEDRLELSLGVSEKFSEKLSRVKDLISQQKSRSISSEEALETALEAFIQRHDPIKKAQRNVARKIDRLEVENSEQSDTKHGTCRANQRKAINSAVKHAVTLRDLRQCTFTNVNGHRCRHTKWLDIHHVVPVSEGGTNAISNLTTLCSAHHRLAHRH